MQNIRDGHGSIDYSNSSSSSSGMPTIPVCGGSFVDGASSDSLATRICEWSLRVLGAVIIVGGVAGNSVTAYVQATERSHRGTTRFLMVFLALVDCAVLLVAVVRYWLTETLGLDIRDQHPALCRLHQALVATVSDLAVYALCGIGVERFILVAFPHRAGRLVTRRNFAVVFGLVSVGITAKNAPIAFFRYTAACVQLLAPPPMELAAQTLAVLNASQLGRPPYTAYRLMPNKCKYDRAFGRWFAKLDVITFLVVPYTVLLVCNVYIYAAMRRQRRGMQQQQQQQQQEQSEETEAMLVSGGVQLVQRSGAVGRKPESVMRLLAVLTVIHICTTLPASVGQLLSVDGWLGRSEASRVTLDALKTLMFANNATNFLAYFVSSRSFRDRVLRCGLLRGVRVRVTQEHASMCGAQPNSLRSEHEAVQARWALLIGAASFVMHIFNFTPVILCAIGSAKPLIAI